MTSVSLLLIFTIDAFLQTSLKLVRTAFIVAHPTYSANTLRKPRRSEAQLASFYVTARGGAGAGAGGECKLSGDATAGWRPAPTLCATGRSLVGAALLQGQKTVLHLSRNRGYRRDENKRWENPRNL